MVLLIFLLNFFFYIHECCVTTGASLEGMIGAVASPMSFFHSNFYNLYHLPIVHIYYIIYEILPSPI